MLGEVQPRIARMDADRARRELAAEVRRTAQTIAGC